MKKARLISYQQDGFKLEEENKEQDDKEDKDDDDAPTLRCSFLCLAYVKDMLISGGDDGYVLPFNLHPTHQLH